MVELAVTVVEIRQVRELLTRLPLIRCLFFFFTCCSNVYYNIQQKVLRQYLHSVDLAHLRKYSPTIQFLRHCAYQACTRHQILSDRAQSLIACYFHNKGDNKYLRAFERSGGLISLIFCYESCKKFQARTSGQLTEHFQS